MASAGAGAAAGGSGVLPIPDFDSQPSDLTVINSYLRPYIEEGAWWPFVHHSDVYQAGPGELARRFRPALASDGERCWFFFTTPKARSGSGGRKIRSIPGKGTWQGERSAIEVRDPLHEDALQGYASTFTFIKKDPVSRKRIHQGWLMTEYSLLPADQGEHQGLVLNKIYHSPRTPVPVTPEPPSPPSTTSLPDAAINKEVAPPLASLPRPKHSSPSKGALLDAALPNPPACLRPPMPVPAPQPHKERSPAGIDSSTPTPPLQSTPVSLCQEEYTAQEEGQSCGVQHLSDQVLLLGYLKPHLHGSKFIYIEDVYRMHPSQLTATFSPASSSGEGESSWFFYSVGGRGTCRWVDDTTGYWKSQYGVKSVKLGGNDIGTRHLFTFLNYMHLPTEWSMVELALLGASSDTNTKLYRVYCKNRKRDQINDKAANPISMKRARYQVMNEVPRQGGMGLDLNEVPSSYTELEQAGDTGGTECTNHQDKEGALARTNDREMINGNLDMHHGQGTTGDGRTYQTIRGGQGGLLPERSTMNLVIDDDSLQFRACHLVCTADQSSSMSPSVR